MATAKRELAIAKGVSGIEGFMYTTWRSDYTQLCSYAETIFRGYGNSSGTDQA